MFNSTGVKIINPAHSRNNRKKKKIGKATKTEIKSKKFLISFQESVLCKVIYQTNNKNRQNNDASKKNIRST